jgi:hypothetical protein
MRFDLILDLLSYPCLDSWGNCEILRRECEDSSEDIDDLLSKRVHLG